MTDKIIVKQLSPLAWIIIPFILVSLPLAILYKQTKTLYEAEYEQAQTELRRKLEKSLSQAGREIDQKYQLQWLYQLFFNHEKIHIDSESRNKVIKNLRSWLPKIKIIFFDKNYNPDWAKSYFTDVKRPFENFIKLIAMQKNRNRLGDAIKAKQLETVKKLKEQIKADALERETILKNLPKWFGAEAPMHEILHDPETIFPIVDWKERRAWLSWGLADDENKNHLGGTILIMEEKQLPFDFALKAYLFRHEDRLAHIGVQIGWVNSIKNRCPERFPSLLPRYSHEFFKKTLASSSMTFFVEENEGVMVALKRLKIGFVLFSAASIKSIQMEFNHKLLKLRLLLIFIIIAPLFIVTFFRFNHGISLSLRWQVTGLFLFAIGIPTFAAFQFSKNRVLDHQLVVEQRAFQKMEDISTIISNGFQQGLDNFEATCEIITNEICKSNVDVFHLRPENTDFLEKTLEKSFEQAGGHHLFFANESGKIIFRLSRKHQEGKNLEPIMGALAKVKLKIESQDVGTKFGSVGFYDIIVEQAGSLYSDIKHILNSQKKVFDFKAFNQTLYVFCDVIKPDPKKDKNLVVIITCSERYFENRYLTYIINNLYTREEHPPGLEVFGVLNTQDPGKYFVPTEGPGNRYYGNALEPFRGKLLERSSATLRDGVSVKDHFFYKKRHYLFMSQRLKDLTQHIIILLYNYTNVEKELANLQTETHNILVLSMIIALVLGGILSRSLIQPIQKISEGVHLISANKYDTAIFMPGKDELVELAEGFNQMAQGLWEREKMTSFLSQGALETIKKSGEVQMGGCRIFASVLFSDIRSFTTISESTDPEQVVQMLNDYFGRMALVVKEYGGDIDKFIGDAIMAVFRPTEENPNALPGDLAANATRCGLAMMEALREFNNERQMQGLFGIGIGVGINSGEVISGVIGAVKRKELTVIGDTVNLASRLEGMSKHGKHTHVIISRSTYDLVQQHVKVDKLTESAVKGKTQAVEMFEVISWQHNVS